MLSPPELAHYEEQLLHRQQSVRERLAEMAELCEPVSPDPSIGRLTRNDAMQDQQMALHLRRQLELQQTQLETAIDRLRKGTFGVCVLCKEPIGQARLEVMPESPLCMPCLNKRDRERGMAGST